MNYLMILFTVLLFAAQTVCFKQFNRRYMKNLASYFLFNFLYYSMVVVIFILIGGVPTGFHPYTLLLGMSFGGLFVAAIFCYMKAMEIGPLSYTSLFFSFGLLIPVLLGFIFWNESLSLIQFAGLALLLITFYMGSEPSQDTGHKVNVRWLVLCIVAFVGNGGLMALAKEHQILLPGREVKEFLVLAFGTAALLSLILFLFYHSMERQNVSHFRGGQLALVVLAAGVTTAFGNQLTLYLASRVSAVIQFPLVNGGVVIISTIASALVFKEKLTHKGVIGLALGIVSLFLLSLR